MRHFSSLLAIGAVLAMPAMPALAQSWNPFQRQQPPTQPAPYDFYRGGINRQGFGYVHQMGGGQDANGYYQRPVPVDRAWGGGNVPNGVHGYRSQWDDRLHILYNVENGQIVRQGYFIQRQR